jgi:hypothetical protein
MEEDVKNKEAPELITEMRTCKDNKIDELSDRVELLTAETPLLALRNDPYGERKWFATTYSDEWSGVLAGWFRSWFVCMHVCQWENQMPKM